jgi:hypothetical protein
LAVFAASLPCVVSAVFSVPAVADEGSTWPLPRFSTLELRIKYTFYLIDYINQTDFIICFMLAVTSSLGQAFFAVTRHY